MQLEGFVNVGLILQSGIYALVHHNEVVYVGKAKLLAGRIYNHRLSWGRRRKRMQAGLMPDGKSIYEKIVKGVLFDDVWIRPCQLDEIDKLEYEMINLYKPKHNQYLKHGLPVDISELVAQLVSTRGASAPLLLIEPTFRRRL